MAEMRRLVCVDCGSGFEVPRGPGQPPKRCEKCRGRRPHRKAAGPRRSSLRVVHEVAPDPPAPEPVLEPEAAASVMGPIRAGVEDALSGMPVGNPAAPALEAVARHLAGLLDACDDLRSVPSLSRELRAALVDLRGGEEAGDDEGFGGLSPSLVDSSGG